jgi:phosphoglycerate dehydrogenase-like enzyme
VGFGAIGREVARRAQAFDMAISYCARRRLPAATEAALGVAYLELPELLAESDVVSLHLPLNAATRNLVGEKELSLMKPGAVLINTARGPIVDQVALAAALARGALFGAGLDVFAQEPPAADDRLLGLPNVVLTPHVAGPTAETWQRSLANAYANVQRVAAGQPPLWVIPELA